MISKDQIRIAAIILKVPIALVHSRFLPPLPRKALLERFLHGVPPDPNHASGQDQKAVQNSLPHRNGQDGNPR